MASTDSSAFLSEATRLLVIAIIIGAALLSLFKLFFPEVQTTVLVTVIGLLSAIFAVAWNALWKRRLHKRSAGG